MKNLTYIATIFVCIIFTAIYIMNYNNINDQLEANTLYKVYLSGEEIGYIDSDEKLYDLINDKQGEIKKEYDVDRVYPPSNFDIVEVNTYNNNITDIETIYDQISKDDAFTIKGYTFTLKPILENKSDIVINVLEEEIFDEALQKFIKAFIDEDIYEEYINETQDPIEGEGQIVENMYFLEAMSRKENLISVDDVIFTDVDQLTQYLIFGENADIRDYTVKAGDSVSSIANDHQLSEDEFLIANPEYRNASAILTIGQTVNVTLVQQPILNYVYEMKTVSEEEVDFINKIEIDNSKPYGYSEIKIAGTTGLEIQTKTYAVTNGIQSQSASVDTETIVEASNQVTVQGPTYISSGGSSSINTQYIYTGLDFGPAVPPGNIITSNFAVWRQGEQHNGVDYSGSGYGSPIYAIADGVVTQAANACSGCSRWSSGTYVVISHGNNYYSSYLHMVSGSLKVSVGDTVVKGQQIGGMGSTGWSTGTHLHLGFSIGEPYVGNAAYYNAHKLIYGG